MSAAFGEEVLVWGGVIDREIANAAMWSFNTRKKKWHKIHNGKSTRPESLEMAASFVIDDTHSIWWTAR